MAANDPLDSASKRLFGRVRLACSHQKAKSRDRLGRPAGRFQLIAEQRRQPRPISVHSQTGLNPGKKRLLQRFRIQQ
jgi:hypothetical protein